MIQRRTKTDKLDAQLLANLLRIDQIPLAYVPPKNYQQLRDLTRCRARLGRGGAKAKINLRALLARQNLTAPYKIPFGPRGLAWFRQQDFGPIENLVRDQLIEQLEHYAKHAAVLDGRSSRSAKISHNSKPSWTSTAWASSRRWWSSASWVLVQVAMHVVRDDVVLRNFYTRIRKRSCAKIARVAAARKLAEICWKRLRRWHEWVTTECAIVKKKDSARSQQRQVEPGKVGGFCGALQQRIF